MMIPYYRIFIYKVTIWKAKCAQVTDRIDFWLMNIPEKQSFIVAENVSLLWKLQPPTFGFMMNTIIDVDFDQTLYLPEQNMSTSLPDSI